MTEVGTEGRIVVKAFGLELSWKNKGSCADGQRSSCEKRTSKDWGRKGQHSAKPGVQGSSGTEIGKFIGFNVGCRAGFLQKAGFKKVETSPEPARTKLKNDLGEQRGALSIFMGLDVEREWAGPKQRAVVAISKEKGEPIGVRKERKVGKRRDRKRIQRGSIAKHFRGRTSRVQGEESKRYPDDRLGAKGSPSAERGERAQGSGARKVRNKE